MSSEFDSFLVKTKIGSSRTLRRLTPPERWCYVAGVLALASESPVRGALLIADGEPVTTGDLADQAGVPKTTAASAVEKLKRLGKLEHDDDLGCLIVMRWHAHQPEPKPSDTREAWRARKQRQREKEARDGHGNVPRDITPMSRPEVEVEVEGKESPPTPPRGNRKREQDAYQEQLNAFAREHFPRAPAALVAHLAAGLRGCGDEPTVELLRPLVEEHRPAGAA